MLMMRPVFWPARSRGRNACGTRAPCERSRRASGPAEAGLRTPSSLSEGAQCVCIPFAREGARSLQHVRTGGGCVLTGRVC
eukprot:362584-Chlamydomonas_euryale.AAC.8